MRCQFCGWENPETKSTCEKCNQPLVQTGSSIKSDDVSASDVNQVSDMPTQQYEQFNPKATVRETGADLSKPSGSCPACGYTLDGEDVCPCCGASVAGNVADVGEMDFKKTVRPNHNLRFNPEQPQGFTLVKLSDSEEAIDSTKFDSDEVSLNRDNTDPANQTITSQNQAIVKKEGSKWVITDQSALHSTYVQASRPIELQDGDLILLGDQLFRFEVK